MATRGRHTEQSDAVMRALREADDFVSASQLCDRLHQSGHAIGLATVYRQLGALVASGSADTITMGGKQLYRLCRETPRHHHHLVCEECGKTVEIEPPDGQWLRAIADDNGFTVSHHVLEVFGLCPECRARQRRARLAALQGRRPAPPAAGGQGRNPRSATENAAI